MLPRLIRLSAHALATCVIVAVAAASAQPLLATSAPSAGGSSPDTNLLSFDAGAWIVKSPAEYNEEWSAFWLLDERLTTGWATPQGTVTAQQLVLALPEQTLLTSVEFGTASVDGDDSGSRGAKDIALEISDASATSGFQSVGAFTLKPRLDHQRFPIAKPLAGRWLRVTIKNNYWFGRTISS